MRHITWATYPGCDKPLTRVATGKAHVRGEDVAVRNRGMERADLYAVPCRAWYGMVCYVMVCAIKESIRQTNAHMFNGDDTRPQAAADGLPSLGGNGYVPAQMAWHGIVHEFLGMAWHGAVCIRVGRG